MPNANPFHYRKDRSQPDRLKSFVTHQLRDDGRQRQSRIPESSRCAGCWGTGLRRLDELSLNPDFYRCEDCDGTGRQYSVATDIAGRLHNEHTS